MRAPEGTAAGINDFVRMLKVVMLAAVSAVVGLLLLLFIYREQQVQQKRRALRYAGKRTARESNVPVEALSYMAKGMVQSI
jgi:predicted histidine transporter YuiF (NhaC family)